jgi:hypothetical protein
LALDKQAACLPPGEASAGKQSRSRQAGSGWAAWGVHALLVALHGCACFLLALYRHEHEADITKVPFGYHWILRIWIKKSQNSKIPSKQTRILQDFNSHAQNPRNTKDYFYPKSGF